MTQLTHWIHRRSMFAALLLAACSEDPTITSGDVQRIIISPGGLDLVVGESNALNARALAAGGSTISGTTFTWSSDDASIATVNNVGRVTAVATGTASISATFGTIVGKATVKVTPPPPSGSAIDVYPTLTYQAMTGWEAVAQIGALECNQVAYPIYKNTLLDKAVTELGINRVRLELRSGTENSVDWFARFMSNQIDNSTYRSHWYEIQNDNGDANSANPAGFHWSFMDNAIDNVVMPLRQRLSARGERLYVNLNYVDFGNSSFEHSSDPAEYAELVLAAFQHIQSKYGWVPDAVEMVLEPDNTPNWRGNTIGAALVATGDRLASAGFRPAFIAPSNTNMGSAISYFDDMVKVPRVLEFVTDFSYHRYSGVSESNVRAIAERGSQYGVRTAMLEHIGSGHEDLHEDLLLGRNSGWEQFALGFCTSDNGAQYYTINTSNPSSPVVNEGSRTRFLKQYFRHVRLDAVRIGAASGDDRFSPLAFRNSDGNMVVIIKASDGGSIQVRGLPAGTYGIYYTTNSTSGVAPDVSIGAQQSLTVSIPDAGVVTAFRR